MRGAHHDLETGQEMARNFCEKRKTSCGLGTGGTKARGYFTCSKTLMGTR